MIFADLWRRFHDSKLRDVALRVAQQCESEMVSAVAHKLGAMSEMEARGYIKARAGLLVERRLHGAYTGLKLSRERFSRLETLALETLCRLVYVEVASRRLAPVTVRRAA
jgi:hypothetical protein